MLATFPPMLAASWQPREKINTVLDALLATYGSLCNLFHKHMTRTRGVSYKSRVTPKKAAKVAKVASTSSGTASKTGSLAKRAARRLPASQVTPCP